MKERKMGKKPACRGLSGLIGVLFLTSCFNPLNVPEQVRVTGSPQLSVPLSTGRTIEFKEYFSVEKLRNMIGQSGGLEIYEYGAMTDVQTFLLHYPIEPQSADLSADQFDLDIGNLETTTIEVEIPGAWNGTVNLNVNVPQQLVGLPLPLETGIPPLVSAIPESNRTIELGQTFGDDFVQGSLGAGFLVTEGSNYNFSAITLVLKSSAHGNSSPIRAAQGNKFPLAGLTIYPDTKLVFGGSLTATAAGPVSFAVKLDDIKFSSVTVTTDETLDENITMDLDDLASGGWLKDVTFDMLRVKVELAPPVEGMDITLTNELFWPGPNGETMDISEAAEEGFVVKGMLAFENNSGWKIGFSGGENPSTPAADKDVSQTITVAVAPNAAAPGLTLHNVGPGTNEIHIKPTLDFHWTKATVVPGQVPGLTEDMTGKFPDENGLNINEMFTGGDTTLDLANVNFSEVNLYLYVEGPEALLNICEMEMKAWNEEDSEDFFDTENDPSLDIDLAYKSTGYFNIKDVSPGGVYQNPSNNGKLPEANFSYNMAEIFNKKPRQLILEYSLGFSPGTDIVVENTFGDNKVEFRPSVIIELPFKFNLKPESGQEYAAMKFSGFTTGDTADLLGRSGPNDDTYDFLKSVELYVDYDNTIGLGNTKIHLLLKGDSEPGRSVQLAELKNGTGTMRIILDPDDLAYPFVPDAIEIRTPADQGTAPDQYGTLSIKGGGETGIKLTIRAKASAEFDRTFSLSSSN
jgi:hypothetical protein